MNETTTVSCELAGSTITLETGRMAKQANGSVLVTYGDTQVLVTATANKKVREGQSFFPLTVDYVEKYYAAGRFPGGFFKREARPSTDATLAARLIDRPLRPLFPEGFLNDVHIVATVLSVDDQHDPEICASLGASAALTISDIPFAGPTAAARVGRLNGDFVLNPSNEKKAESDMEVLIAGTEKAISMVEGEAHEIPEEDMLNGLLFGHNSIKPLLAMQKELQEKVGKAKFEFEAKKKNEEIAKVVVEKARSKVVEAFAVTDKLARYEKLDEIKDALVAEMVSEDDEDADQKKADIGDAFGDVKYEVMRTMILDDKKRIDGRGLTDIRQIVCETGVLKRTHGSSLFTRGETQVLATVTLGTKDDEQMIDNLRVVSGSQRFMLHYNFPPYSVGEAAFLRGPGRREIGHGMLAERALAALVPDAEKFPYAIRVVCETLESNGSSSMGSVCSGSMALMDAGVPLENPIAGIAMGLIQEGEKTAVLSDILGDEDHLGDMDFKVAGTKKGVTAIQMDIKIDGVTEDIMRTALEQAHKGRLHILGEMAKAIDTSRDTIAPTAPRITVMNINPEKIRDVIGTGGKVIRQIIEDTGVKIDIEDDGSVKIFSVDQESADKAINIIESITEDVKAGKVYEGTVKKIVDFGAFVECIPGTDGLLHISEIAHERVNNVKDYLKEGDKIQVKVLDVDFQGKVRLSRKALLEKDN